MKLLFATAFLALSGACIVPYAVAADIVGQNTPKAPSILPEQLSKSEQNSAAESKPGQRIERIRTEDAGSRIDELRYGGETRNITVQPKANVPAYEVVPQSDARTSPALRDPTTGSPNQRVWNVFKF